MNVLQLGRRVKAASFFSRSAPLKIETHQAALELQLLDARREAARLRQRGAAALARLGRLGLGRLGARRGLGGGVAQRAHLALRRRQRVLRFLVNLGRVDELAGEAHWAGNRARHLRGGRHGQDGGQGGEAMQGRREPSMPSKEGEDCTHLLLRARKQQLKAARLGVRLGLLIKVERGTQSVTGCLCQAGHSARGVGRSI